MKITFIRKTIMLRCGRLSGATSGLKLAGRVLCNRASLLTFRVRVFLGPGPKRGPRLFPLADRQAPGRAGGHGHSEPCWWRSCSPWRHVYRPPGAPAGCWGPPVGGVCRRTAEWEPGGWGVGGGAAPRTRPAGPARTERGGGPRVPSFPRRSREATTECLR